MVPPVNQPGSASSANSVPTNRAERESKKYDRRSDLVCRVRYTNVLPDLPFDPKFLRYPFSQDRFVRYKPTSLEKNYRWELLTEHDVGVEIDLINPDAYAPTSQVTEDDKRLLEDETASPANQKRSMLNQKSVPWLRKTEYISSEQSVLRASTKIDDTKTPSAKNKLREESLKDLSRERLLQIIEEGFETAKTPLEKHYSKSSVTKVEEWPVFPDFDNWKYPFAQVIFDDDPSRKDPTLTTQDQIEEMSDAVIKALIDNDQKEYIGYFLPTPETRAKRLRDENEIDDENETYEFKLIREYSWNRKDKTMSGFEENYFLAMRDDIVVYNELETRVRLSKRRTATGGIKPANLRLIQRYRSFADSELKTQKKRLRALDNEEQDEEEEEEAEEMGNENDEEQEEENGEHEEGTRDADDDDEQQHEGEETHEEQEQEAEDTSD